MKSSASSRHFHPRPGSPGERGVALVITLIMLSVITFMAVAFLFTSRREAETVETLTQQNLARLAAEASVQYAQAQVMAQILANNNALNFGPLVSRNYLGENFAYYPTSPAQTVAGYNFFATAPVSLRTNIANVSYNYANGSTNLSAADQQQMLNNLLINPRVPVFISTNASQANPEFRFFLDLNRNGKFDTNGLVLVLDDNGNPLLNAGAPLVSSVIGDPEWIGILDHPDQRHSSSNLFLARYCYYAVPIGNDLDINFIGNQAKQEGASGPWKGWFLRNQGVGSWELNLAAFLHTLNTNWDVNGVPLGASSDYKYSTLNYQIVNGTNLTHSAFFSSGYSFDDAAAFLQYRYSNTYSGLSYFANNYSAGAASQVANDFIDNYSRGPTMTGIAPLTIDPEAVIGTSSPWSGSDNPMLFQSLQDYFNVVPFNLSLPEASRIGNSFSNRLYSVGTSNSTYNRYTYYRMTSQMGVGSSAEPTPYPYAGKLNLNYVNVGGLKATNFVPWTSNTAPAAAITAAPYNTVAAQFFTNAADRLIRQTFPYPIIYTNGNVFYTNTLSVTNIPIYPVNFYTPSVHRLLQLAANIYDATTDRQFTNNDNSGLSFPSVFRPLITYTNIGGRTNIYISGYEEVPALTQQNMRGSVTYSNLVMMAPLDLRPPADLALLPIGGQNMASNIYGVPYVIGAKRGFPNFNGFSSIPIVKLQRKLDLVKPAPMASPKSGWATNVQYNIAITNAFGVALWNSYAGPNYYNRSMDVFAANDTTLWLRVTNDLNQQIIFPTNYVNSYSGSVPTNTWVGFFEGSPSATNSFKLPLATTTISLPDSLLYRNPMRLLNSSNVPSPLLFESTPGNFSPKWALYTTNRLRAVMVDHASARIIDYVQLGGLGGAPGLDTFQDINAELASLRATNDALNFWATNVYSAAAGAPSLGFLNQINFAQSFTGNSVPPTVWYTYQLDPGVGSVNSEQQRFAQFINGGNTATNQQVPFVAVGWYTNNFTWSANDPLVHYTVGDLIDPTHYSLRTNLWVSTARVGYPLLNFNSNSVFTGMRIINPDKYQPWNKISAANSAISNNLAYKDSLITQSADWAFPTNRFPNIGWLGRVHRGTPWQTVYLKSTPTDLAAWMKWTGNFSVLPWTTNYPDAALTQPTNDWKILDLFTTAPNENASRGQLSVNNSSTAAWAAVLDGVITLSNVPPSKTNLTGLVPWVISPYDTIAPVSGSGPATNTIEWIVSQINAQRSAANNNGPIYPGGVFPTMGDVLATPALTVFSPYINTNNGPVRDEVYERIPQQILSLLRLGTPRYAIYAYGQSLKPADHSIVQNGAFAGLVTNYTITGEVATRTIVRFEPASLKTGNPSVTLPDPRMLNSAYFPYNYNDPYNYLNTNFPNYNLFKYPALKPVVESFMTLPPE